MLLILNNIKNSIMKSKIQIIMFAAATLFSSIYVSSCKSPSESENSELKDDMNAVEQDLQEVKEDAKEKYEAFKMDAETKIDANLKALEELKNDAKDKSKEVKADLDKKIDELKMKNETLREKIRDYKEEGDDKWEAFKTEFGKDMDNLGEALKEVVKK